MPLPGKGLRQGLRGELRHTSHLPEVTRAEAHYRHLWAGFIQHWAAVGGAQHVRGLPVLHVGFQSLSYVLEMAWIGFLVRFSASPVLLLPFHQN